MVPGPEAAVGRLVVIADRLVDGTGAPPMDRPAIEIVDGRIAAVTARGRDWRRPRRLAAPGRDRHDGGARVHRRARPPRISRSRCPARPTRCCGRRGATGRGRPRRRRHDGPGPGQCGRDRTRAPGRRARRSDPGPADPRGGCADHDHRRPLPLVRRARRHPRGAGRGGRAPRGGRRRLREGHGDGRDGDAIEQPVRWPSTPRSSWRPPSIAPIASGSGSRRMHCARPASASPLRRRGRHARARLDDHRAAPGRRAGRCRRRRDVRHVRQRHDARRAPHPAAGRRDRAPAGTSTRSDGGSPPTARSPRPASRWWSTATRARDRRGSTISRRASGPSRSAWRCRRSQRSAPRRGSPRRRSDSTRARDDRSRPSRRPRPHRRRRGDRGPTRERIRSVLLGGRLVAQDGRLVS